MDKVLRKENRKQGFSGRPSRMICLCLSLSATVIACQFGNIFIPEVLLAAAGRGLEEEQSYAVHSFLREANKLDAREMANMEHESSRQAGQKKETRKQRRKKKKEDKLKKKEKNRVDKKIQAANTDKTTSAKKSDNDTSLKKLRTGIEPMRKRPSSVEPTDQEIMQAISDAIDPNVHSGSAKLASNDCTKPRNPVWEYESFSEQHHHDESKASKRLLVGLYSGYGVYSTLFSKTANVNRAYARHWKHDVVSVQGAALRLKELDGECEPPPHRATYDKIPLLQYALEHKDKYDQLLILDTDALVYELDFDVTTILPKGRMLAAQKVRLTDDHETWDVNAGVTLWDLHHPRIQKLSKEWLKHSKNGMIHNSHASNDQYHLHYALKDGNYMKDIFAVDEEFNYGHGTIVKHFIRKPGHKQWGEAGILDNRENRIEIAIKDICKEHRQICEAVQKKSYIE
jgi:hypothetical protein